MNCTCLNSMAGIGPESFGLHHHKNCEHYATEKFSFLFYYDESFDSWILADDLEDYVSGSGDGESIEVELKVIELTDKEHEELPEELPDQIKQFSADSKVFGQMPF